MSHVRCARGWVAVREKGKLALEVIVDAVAQPTAESAALTPRTVRTPAKLQ